ncbi:MAG: lasso peptide biosynthesis B2 protein [Clostridiaceae bacterium]
MNWRDKLLFFEAFILTGIARGSILFIKFNKLKKYMGNHNTESPMEVDLEVYNTTVRIRRAVLKASQCTPWESKCLVQALTVQRMLKWRNISSTIYLGVNKDKDNKMQAHAWSRVGEIIVTGGEVKDAFTQVSKFSS